MPTKPFIRIAEYWVPSSDGSLLEFGGGLFGPHSHFAAASRNLCFGRGEGLPGQVWERGHPIVLRDLEGSYFRRAAAARAAGVTCGIAMPIYTGQRLSAVAVIYCGDDEEHAGAIELWANAADSPQDMALVDGYYGTTGDTFEFISRSTIFRKGTGLPGMAWQREAPVFLEDLGKGSGFLREDSAVLVGINRGMAIPCSTLDGSSHVLAFLSALATPIALRLEVWQPSPGSATLHRSFSFSEETGRQDSPVHGTKSPVNHHAHNPIEQAFVTAIPVVADPMIAIPIAPQGRTSAVMALYF